MFIPHGVAEEIGRLQPRLIPVQDATTQQGRKQCDTTFAASMAGAKYLGQTGGAQYAPLPGEHVYNRAISNNRKRCYSSLRSRLGLSSIAFDNGCREAGVRPFWTL